MRKVISICCLALLPAAFSACTKNMKAAEYVRYISGKENGLLKTVQVGGFEYRVQYKPYDYIALMEQQGQHDYTAIARRKAELKGTAWFNISIKRIDNAVTPLRYGLSSRGEYDARLDYFLNRAQKDIWLIYGTDTIRPVSYLFENNYNLTPMETMVVGFYLPKGTDAPAKGMQLSYNDQVFKNGIIKVNYSEKTLKNIPELAN